MATVISEERQISAPNAEVWRLLTDWDAASTWMGAKDLRLDGPLAKGARLTFQSRGKQQASTIEQIDVPRLLTLRSVQGSVTADYTYRLGELSPGTTTVALLVELSVRGWMRILAPVIGAAIRRADRQQLDRFVDVVHARGRTGT